ncbi:hypothetical protein KCP76_00640 [Salmonella enterica subsp. enterica serovar Weltevreden]|nr:hypothetical protein KCP76_00640 [Salmonella enterica subsp. enterica serovar Weltevreden]
MPHGARRHTRRRNTINAITSKEAAPFMTRWLPGAGNVAAPAWRMNWIMKREKPYRRAYD